MRAKLWRVTNWLIDFPISMVYALTNVMDTGVHYSKRLSFINVCTHKTILPLKPSYFHMIILFLSDPIPGVRFHSQGCAKRNQLVLSTYTEANVHEQQPCPAHCCQAYPISSNNISLSRIDLCVSKCMYMKLQKKANSSFNL